MHNKRFIFLDYLRIFAFSSVLIGHKFYPSVKELMMCMFGDGFIANLMLQLFYGGGCGVVVFFLVSGYIITHVLMNEEPSVFAIKRLFRIYPLYFVMVLGECTIKTLVYDQHAPPINILIAQLLLIGDFFSVPYSLGDVEWTLRVEMLFYVFMLTIKMSSLWTKFRKFLPVVLLALSSLLAVLGPFPTGLWAEGYVSIFSPILFVGVGMYLFEHQEIRATSFAGFCLFIYAQYSFVYHLFRGKPSELFPLVAFALFVAAWRYRNRLPETTVVVFVSNLTYAVYLSHNWIWTPLSDVLSIVLPYPYAVKFLTLFSVLLISAAGYFFVERNGITLGKRMLQWREESSLSIRASS